MREEGGRREQVGKILLKQNIFVLSLAFAEAFHKHIHLTLNQTLKDKQLLMKSCVVIQ